ncbi:YVTN family beta-propeller repeat-containing protein, partial [Bacillus cereus]|uniref:YncE family protein n=1 Tax=Bacillus cereus TaxID=1396 RepID=UPI003C6C1502|nr:YVTN family beta-propeller repeat-containing protein [Bacillus cereus]
NQVWVVNISSNNVSVIDASSYAKLTTIAVGSGPYGVAVDAANNQVWVVNISSNNVSVIDASSYAKLTTIAVGSGPYGVAVDAA